MVKKLKEEDLNLWKEITSSIQPLKVNKKILEGSDKKPSKSDEKNVSTEYNSVKILKKIIENFNELKIKKNIEYTGIDRRTNQKMTRGNVQIDATLDLHGCTQIEAYDLLYDFLVKSYQYHLKLVLVITGKGRIVNYNEFNSVGVLKANLPIWLKEDKFFNIVNGYKFSHQRHGGAGAYYILLKSK
jgi:DNA-nicking Smr family endonuclease